MQKLDQNDFSIKIIGLFFLFLLCLFFGHPANAKNLAVRWQSLEKGIDYRQIILSKTYPYPKIHAFKINLSRYELKLIRAPQKNSQGISIKESALPTPAILAVNGGFFTPEFSPIGLRISQSQLYHPIKRSGWLSIFWIKQEVAKISSFNEFLRLRNMRPDFAIQAGPRLLINKSIPRLKKGLDERVALGINDQNQVILIATENASLSTETLAEWFLKSESDGGLACHDALNLDGGQSTQLFVRTAKLNFSVRNLSQVADGIIVVPR